jgi:hypothetical protein
MPAPIRVAGSRGNYAASAMELPDRTGGGGPADLVELAGRAVATGDEHAFKFVEA